MLRLAGKPASFAFPAPKLLFGKSRREASFSIFWVDIDYDATAVAFERLASYFRCCQFKLGEFLIRIAQRQRVTLPRCDLDLSLANAGHRVSCGSNKRKETR